MHAPGRLILSCLPPLCLIAAGCNSVPQHALRDSQLAAYSLAQQNQALALERDQYNIAAQQATVQAQQAAAQAQAALAQNSQQSLHHATLSHQVSKLTTDLKSSEAELAIARQRLDNLASERGALQDRYVSLLKQSKDAPSTLSDEAKRRFADLARRYPNFEFDPVSGVSKFHSDILFDSGSDALNPSAIPLLKEFASIMNSGTATQLNVLIAGHTDDLDIVKPGTAARHPTNWHLSTNRANAVALAMARTGLAEHRLGVSGYSKYQPTVPNTDAPHRSQNRRVEIFVLAPDALVAGWERPGTARR